MPSSALFQQLESAIEQASGLRSVFAYDQHSPQRFAEALVRALSLSITSQ
jgi:hypothetical protein